MNNDDVSNELNVFSENKGRSLRAYGSAEFALRKPDALHFLELLEKYGLYPLGIESWRDVGGEFAIDTLGGWYCESKDHAENLEAAREFIGDFKGNPEDFFTIQF